MHRVNAWKTNDGQYFDNEALAARHEAIEQLSSIISKHMTSPTSCEALIEAMLQRAGEMANLFSKYSQLHPRTQVKPDAVSKEETETG